MKNILLSSFIIIIIVSCEKNKDLNEENIGNAIENAEKSDSRIFKSSYGSDLVENTYAEIIKRDKKLLLINKKITEIDRESDKVLTDYRTIISKSESFYEDAKQKASYISDSLQKNKILNEIKISSDKYDLKLKTIKSHISNINLNLNKINDWFYAFKIRKTLPEIEKYQNAHPLKTDSLEIYIIKQNKLLDELKNLK